MKSLRKTFTGEEESGTDYVRQVSATGVRLLRQTATNYIIIHD